MMVLRLVNIRTCRRSSMPSSPNKFCTLGYALPPHSMSVPVCATEGHGNQARTCVLYTLLLLSTSTECSNNSDNICYTRGGGSFGAQRAVICYITRMKPRKTFRLAHQPKVTLALTNKLSKVARQTTRLLHSHGAAAHPKKMCSPVSYTSPSSSRQAHTLPPSTSRASSTTGWCPASARYLAVLRPARPACPAQPSALRPRTTAKHTPTTCLNTSQ